MPYGCKCLELVVNNSKTIVQHARTSDKLHVCAKTGQIIESKYDTPYDTGLAVSG